MFKDVKDDGTGENAVIANEKLPVKYVGVEENGVLYYVNIGQTFRTE